MSGPSCLCGHGEWCEVCRTQPPTVEESARIRAMTPGDWSRRLAVAEASLAVEDAHDMGNYINAQMGRASAETLDRDVAEALLGASSK